MGIITWGITRIELGGRSLLPNILHKISESRALTCESTKAVRFVNRTDGQNNIKCG